MLRPPRLSIAVALLATLTGVAPVVAADPQPETLVVGVLFSAHEDVPGSSRT